MRFLYTALAALAISTGVFGSVMADDITADVLTYDGNTKVVNAKGTWSSMPTREPPLRHPRGIPL